MSYFVFCHLISNPCLVCNLQESVLDQSRRRTWVSQSQSLQCDCNAETDCLCLWLNWTYSQYVELSVGKHWF